MEDMSKLIFMWPVPGLGDGETELCFEGHWLPLANEYFQPPSAKIKIIADRELTVIFNGKLIESQEQNHFLPSNRIYGGGEKHP